MEVFFDPIRTLADINSLITNTYIFSLINTGFFLLVSIVVAILMPYEPGQHDRSYIKRRIWFFVIWFLSFGTFFVYNYFLIMPLISNVSFMDKFMKAIAISTGIIFVAYGLIGFMIMKLFPRSKYGSMLK